MTSTRPKEESSRISDASKIDNFAGLPETIFSEPLGYMATQKDQLSIF